jgi:DNA-binding transcriptional MerR regulator
MAEAVPVPRHPALTIGAVARHLGVAVETLRSWEARYGLGPREHTPGARRRYTPDDVERLERFCRLVGDGVAAADAARAVLSGYAQADTGETGDRRLEAGTGRTGGGHTLPVGRSGSAAARGLARSAVRMDQAQVLELLEAALERDGVIGAWEEVITPALLAVGRKWTETSGRYVEVEHLLSWSVGVALHRRLPAPGASTVPFSRTVLLACAPEEWHSLPLEVLHAALAERGVPTRMLGAAVPGEALREAARRIQPAHIVVWSQTPRTADPACLSAVRANGRSTTFAAGPGWATGRLPAPVLTTLTEAIQACT